MILPAFTALLEESLPKTGVAFMMRLQLNAGFAPKRMPFVTTNDALTGVSEFLKMQANGRHDAAERMPPPPFPAFAPNNGDPSRYQDETHALYESVYALPEQMNAQATDRYECLARTTVPSALVVMTTLKADGNTSKPFIAVVAFPTAFRQGHTRQKIWAGPQPATLKASNIAGPAATAFVVMATLAQNTHDPIDTPDNIRTPEGYLNWMGAVICFSENGALFSAVVGLSHTAPNIRNAAFADEHQRLQGETW
jgi:hypothetical protein